MTKKFLTIPVLVLLFLFATQEVASAALWWGAVAKRAAKRMSEADPENDPQQSNAIASGNQRADADNTSDESGGPIRRLGRKLSGRLNGSSESADQ